MIDEQIDKERIQELRDTADQILSKYHKDLEELLKQVCLKYLGRVPNLYSEFDVEEYQRRISTVNHRNAPMKTEIHFDGVKVAELIVKIGG